MTTRNVRSKMRDMNGNINDFHSEEKPTSSDNDSFDRRASKTSSKGDYIDFEEIK